MGGSSARAQAVAGPGWQRAPVARRAHGPRPVVLRHFALSPSVCHRRYVEPPDCAESGQGCSMEKYPEPAESNGDHTPPDLRAGGIDRCDSFVRTLGVDHLGASRVPEAPSRPAPLRSRNPWRWTVPGTPDGDWTGRSRTLHQASARRSAFGLSLCDFRTRTRESSLAGVRTIPRPPRSRPADSGRRREPHGHPRRGQSGMAENGVAQVPLVPIRGGGLDADPWFPHVSTPHRIPDEASTGVLGVGRET